MQSVAKLTVHLVDVGDLAGRYVDAVTRALQATGFVVQRVSTAHLLTQGIGTYEPNIVSVVVGRADKDVAWARGPAGDPRRRPVEPLRLFNGTDRYVFVAGDRPAELVAREVVEALAARDGKVQSRPLPASVKKTRHDVFISYRRSDSEHPAHRLATDLRPRVPGSEIFQDVNSIEPGADFERALDQGLARSVAVLVLVGRGWLTAVDDQGRRRLEQADDWVRQEVARSLAASDVRVVPVLLDNVAMPGVADLPAPLQPLTRRQAMPLTVRHWAQDVDHIAGLLNKLINEARAT